MRNFFRVDGKFYAWSGVLVDCLALSLLWLLASLPIVTAGAATAAAYHAAEKAILRSESTLWREFKAAFLDNWKQSTVVWILTLLSEVFMFYDIRICEMQYLNGITSFRMKYIFMALMAFLFFWFLSACAYMTKFRNPLRLVIRNSLLCLTRSLKNTAGVILVTLAALGILRMFFRTIIVVPGFFMVGFAFFMNRIYNVCLGLPENDTSGQHPGDS